VALITGGDFLPLGYISGFEWMTDEAYLDSWISNEHFLTERKK
jgi:hypothetical protein